MKAKRFLSGILAISASVSCLSCMTACQTDRPKVQMEITFQNESYVLDYTLYRKVAPATVEHFLTLAGNGYYDNVVVHDYDNTRMYTGAYEHDETEDSGLKYKSYYDIVKTYDYFPTTVYTQGKAEKLYTLMGEFADNDIEVKNGKKKEAFGTLSMFYTDKKADTYTVTVQHPEAGTGNRDYKYNSATSMFFISIGVSETNNNQYCTFATLNEDSKDVLTDLKETVEEYLKDNEDALEEKSVKVDADDPFVGATNKTVVYDVMQSPITIKKVTVKSR